MAELSWALTVPQPAAWAISHGHQTVYNRQSGTDQRGWIAICAGSYMDDDLKRSTHRLTGRSPETLDALCGERNAIVAVARLVDVCEARGCDCGSWADKRLIHWKLADAVPLAEPVPAPHIVGHWRMPADLADAVEQQWQLTERPIAGGEITRGGQRDFLAVRDELLPLPGHAEGYRHVLLLGTTGAGKTTVVRQLLGTDPETERFPSTSTAKTTVADTEITLTGGGPFRAAVTFAGRDEITDHLRDNVWEAARAVFEGRSQEVIQNRLLDHVSQRYRFSYLLGRAALPHADSGLDDDLDDDESDDGQAAAPAARATDPGTTALVQNAVRAIEHVVTTQLENIRNAAGAGEDDRPLEEYVEDELETRVRHSDICERIVDAFLHAVENRFALLAEGDLRHDPDGWPVSWSWECADRAEFLRVITKFSSNQAAFFGRLLTPLVNGIRTAGPFRAVWAEHEARLVLIDGEGLGHTPGSIAEVSTPLRKRLDEVDSIVLVDNAQQPMQAAPVAVMRTAAATGNGEKLFFLFTHFDLVKGDNLGSFSDRERHVLGSAENVLSDVREELGLAERTLRRRLDEARFFVGGIDRVLDPERVDPVRPKASLRTMRQLNGLLEALREEAVQVETGPARPVYKSGQLTDAVVEAVRAFHIRWRGALGVSFDSEVPKKHWSSIKALTRRLSEGHTDEYRDLRPATSLRTALEYAIYRMLQKPVRWTGPEPDSDEQEAIVGDISNALGRRLGKLVDRLITEDPRPDWTRAYEEHGKGSTFRRAQILIGDIYERAIPRALRDEPYENRFSRAVLAAFEETAAELDFIVE
ncbi:hypothetical protein [Actinomadura coerulea]|uniref:hypothetical protein n=1 Tax=Actinomadura coerulea TaxID=46159 RepID=UPI0034243AC3